jgi:hypothetical protein
MFQTLITGEEAQLVNVNEIIQRTLRLLAAGAQTPGGAGSVGGRLPRTLAVGRLQQAFTT